MSPEIQSRNAMHSLFQRRLEGTQENLVEDQSLEQDQKMLKTYIIESNISPEDFIDSCNLVKDYGLIDENLYSLSISTYGEEGDFYLDSNDDRFWSLYTLTGSQFARHTFNKLTTKNGNGLDHPWIPNETQREIMKLGEFKGAGLKQHGKKAFPEEYVEKYVDVGDFRLELSGDDSQRFYSAFKESADIEKVLSLSRIKIRRTDQDDYITERITNDGAFTARGGTNIRLHLDIVQKVKDTYYKLINIIESDHRISYKNVAHGTRVRGKHIRINLDNRIQDIEEFITHVVNAQDPFRLMGTATKLEDEYYKVKAVDLHNGDKVTLEIGPSWIRIYLFDDACGNTALRVYTNLQQFYDPAAEMVLENV